jgi:hypothetical protein
MQSYKFDDRNITWRKFDYLGSAYYVCAADEQNGTVDVVIKFPPNRRGELHQHLMAYSTFVLQGELRFYRPNGELKEIRPTGSYVLGIANGEPHSEGAGDEEAIVLFSIRGGTGDMFAIFEKETGEVHKLGFVDFKAALADQIASGAASKVGPRAP